MTDASATTVWEIQARPFGDEADAIGTVTLNLRFPGQYHDEETGLNHNYFRDYSPGVGRYVEPDPLGIRPGDAHLYTDVVNHAGFSGGLNLYVYVENNPLNAVDPMGLHMVPVGPFSNVMYHTACIDGHEHPNRDFYAQGCAGNKLPHECENDWWRCMAVKQGGLTVAQATCIVICLRFIPSKKICLPLCYGAAGYPRLKCKESCDKAYRSCMGYNDPDAGCDECES